MTAYFRRCLPGVALLCCGMLLPGCQSINQSIKNTEKFATAHTVSLPGPEQTRTFTLTPPNVDPRRVRDALIVNTLRHAISGGTRYYHAIRYMTRKDGHGLLIQMELDYQSYTSSNGTYSTEATANFRISIEHQGNSASVVVRCPSRFTMEPFSLYSKQSVMTDLPRICSHLNLEITRYKNVEGRLMSKYSPDSIYGNFERMASRAANPWANDASAIKSFDIVKARTFKVSVGSTAYDVGVTIYPYHDETLILYAVHYVYHLYGNGTTDGSKAGIKRARAAVAHIVND